MSGTPPIRAAALAAAFAAGLAGCAPPPPGPAPGALPLLGGYRGADDACRRIGESAETVQFLDHTRDLVGCPEGSAAARGFAAATGATEVGRIGGYRLFSVPI